MGLVVLVQGTVCKVQDPGDRGQGTGNWGHEPRTGDKGQETLTGDAILMILG